MSSNIYFTLNDCIHMRPILIRKRIWTGNHFRGIFLHVPQWVAALFRCAVTATGHVLCGPRSVCVTSAQVAIAGCPWAYKRNRFACHFADSINDKQLETKRRGTKTRCSKASKVDKSASQAASSLFLMGNYFLMRLYSHRSPPVDKCKFGQGP